MPADLIREIGVLTKTAVLVNRDLRKLPKEKADLIIAAADEVVAGKLHALHAVLEAKSPELAATPLVVDQEISGWSSLIERDLGWIRLAIDGFYALALVGTAVGTGLKAQPEFAQRNGKT